MQLCGYCQQRIFCSNVGKGNAISSRNKVYSYTKGSKNAQNQPKPTPREELDLYLNELNKNILVDLEDGLLSAHARIQGQICVVVYTIDENKLDISGFEKVKSL